MSTTPDWADEKAREIVHSYLASFHISPRPNTPRINIYDDIAAHLREAAKVPDGCVRLPDGRDVKVSALGMEVLVSFADGKEYFGQSPITGYNPHGDENVKPLFWMRHGT